MKSIYYVDPNGVLSEHELFDGIDESPDYTLVYDSERVGIIKLPKSGIHVTYLSALQRVRDVVQREAQLESQNVKSASARRDDAISRLVDLNTEIFNLKHSK